MSFTAQFIRYFRLSKMDDVSQTVFSHAFSEIKILIFWLESQWNFLLRAQRRMIVHWFMSWLGPEHAMMESSNRNVFRLTRPLCGEFIDHRCIPLTLASDAEIWCFLWSAPEQTVHQTSRRRWFETPSRSLWRHSNATNHCLSKRWLSSIMRHYVAMR